MSLARSFQRVYDEYGDVGGMVYDTLQLFSEASPKRLERPSVALRLLVAALRTVALVRWIDRDERDIANGDILDILADVTTSHYDAHRSLDYATDLVLHLVSTLLRERMSPVQLAHFQCTPVFITAIDRAFGGPADECDRLCTFTAGFLIVSSLDALFTSGVMASPTHVDAIATCRHAMNRFHNRNETPDLLLPSIDAWHRWHVQDGRTPPPPRFHWGAHWSAEVEFRRKGDSAPRDADTIVLVGRETKPITLHMHVDDDRREIVATVPSRFIRRVDGEPHKRRVTISRAMREALISKCDFTPWQHVQLQAGSCSS